jgi:hypothetical protein
LSTALIIVGGDNGEFVLSELVFFHVGMPLISCHFSNLNFFDNLVYTCPLQAYVAIGLTSKYFYLLHVLTSRSKGSNNVYHFCHDRKRTGCTGLLAFAGLCCLTAYRGRRVPKSKVVDNIFIFIFILYAFSLKHFAEEI